jgi:hypothetical protein
MFFFSLRVCAAIYLLRLLQLRFYVSPNNINRLGPLSLFLSIYLSYLIYLVALMFYYYYLLVVVVFMV